MNTKTSVKIVTPLLLCFLLTACVSYTELMKQTKEEVERQFEPVRRVQSEYEERLASDPDIAIIRGKSGISFNSCSVDNFDLAVPTSAERVALRKFGRLQQEYFDELNRATASVEKTFGGLGRLIRQKNSMKQHIQALLALYQGKITWSRYGQLCEAIDDARFEQEVAREAQLWEGLQRDMQENWKEQRKERTEERRHQETIEALRRR